MGQVSWDKVPEEQLGELRMREEFPLGTKTWGSVWRVHLRSDFHYWLRREEIYFVLADKAEKWDQLPHSLGRDIWTEYCKKEIFQKFIIGALCKTVSSVSLNDKPLRVDGPLIVMSVLPSVSCQTDTQHCLGTGYTRNQYQWTCLPLVIVTSHRMRVYNK